MARRTSLFRRIRRRVTTMIRRLFFSLLLIAAISILAQTFTPDGWRGLLDQARRILTGQTTPKPSPPLPRDADSVTGVEVYFAPYTGARISGEERFLNLLRGAEISLYCAFHELDLDSAADTLIERHQKGVDVRIVTDTDYMEEKALIRCIEAGIPVVPDNRSALMHDKFCVVDGRYVWTGSTNVTGNCFYRNDNNALVLDSPDLADNYTIEFMEMQRDRLFGPGSPRNTPFPEVRIAATRIECYFAPEDDAGEAIIKTLSATSASVDILAFSFTSRPIAEAIAGAIQRGARVRGVMEKSGASSSHAQDDWLIRQGADIRLDTGPGFMHNKVLILDATTVVTGSYNFSANADESNDENLLIIHSPDIAGLYGEEFDRIYAEAGGG